MSEIKNDEKSFLHDLASPLGTAMLLTQSVLDNLQSQSTIQPDDIDGLNEAYNALKEIKEMLQNRRSIVLAQENKKDK